MKYIQKPKEYLIKKIILGSLFFTYYSTQVFAQIEKTGTATPTPPIVGNLDEKTLQQLVADFILMMSGYVLKILLAVIILTFFYGLMKYMFKGQGSDTARAEGRQIMLWGIIGIFVITSIWGLVAIFSSFVGHDSVVIPQFK